MAAGDSAGAEARRQLALADAHARASVEARAAAARYGIAEITEKRTAILLAPLTALGHHLLADRGWPGSRRAQVDLVVVGPGGVFIVDTKAWKDVTIAQGRIRRGQEDVTEDLMALADLAYAAEADLAEVGLAPGEVRPVVVLAGHQGVAERIGPIHIVGERDVLRHIAAYGSRLTAAQVDSVLTRSLSLFPLVGAPAPVSAVVAEPVLSPVEAVVPSRSESDDLALLTESEVSEAMLASILASPVEEWMSFLHPSQAKLVRRSFNGPARIRGAAGTGKTVVGLHRAAYLARSRPGRVLITTFVRTLPGVLRQHLIRMAPEIVDRVEFMGIHQLARGILRDRGVTQNLSDAKAREAFAAAWESVGKTSPLTQVVSGSEYWSDEIQYVVKGRGITRFEQYADLARTGRSYRLTVDHRRALWALFEAYTANLREAGVHDFADVILLAESELQREPMADPYGAVIVDEAQDLSCAMVRLLHRLVGEGPDAITLIGDGQQSIYPGGYTLAEAGISLQGRGVVLDVNYRNTAQILAFASRLVTGDEYADIEGAMSRGDAPRHVPRSGPEPVVEACGSWAERDGRLVAEVRRALTAVGSGPGDIGVLCLTAAAVRRSADALRQAGVPVVLLADYDGTVQGAVKVGTVKRAKGLEFKHVLMVDARRDDLESASPVPDERRGGQRPAVSLPSGDDADAERRRLRRRELYVGMTRARDSLWVAVT